MSGYKIPYAGTERREPVSPQDLADFVNVLREFDARLSVQSEKMSAIETDIKEVKQELSVLSRVWTEARGALKFLTFLVAFGAAGWQVLLWIKDHIIFKGN